MSAVAESRRRLKAEVGRRKRLTTQADRQTGEANRNKTDSYRQFILSTITEGENISQGETTLAYKKKPTMCMSNIFAPNSTTPMLPAHLTSQAGNENLVLSECSSASRIQYCQDGLRLPKQNLHLDGELAKRLPRCTDQNMHITDEAVKSSPQQQPLFRPLLYKGTNNSITGQN